MTVESEPRGDDQESGVIENGVAAPARELEHPTHGHGAGARRKLQNDRAMLACLAGDGCGEGDGQNEGKGPHGGDAYGAPAPSKIARGGVPSLSSWSVSNTSCHSNLFPIPRT